MDGLRSLKNSDSGTDSLYVSKDLPPSNPLNSSGFSYNEINSRTNDLGRITKLIGKKPGLKFIGNINKLNQVDTSAKIQRAGNKNGQFDLKSFTNDLKGKLLDGAVKTATQLGTVLAQVPVNGTGLHFINGLAPNGYIQAGDADTGLGDFLKDIGIGGGVNGAKSVKNGMPVSTNVEQRLEGLLQSDGTATNLVIDENLPTSTYSLPKESIENKFKNNSTGVSLTYDYINGLVEQTETILGEENDIIPFEFHRLKIDQVESSFLYFRAFLDTFNDNYGGDWQATRYIGRAEEFYTYQGFNRSIDFTFKIAAFSKKEIKPLYRKLNLLAGLTAPTYNKNKDFMRGSLTSITVGDYLVKQTGFINNISLAWNVGYPWEVETGDTDTKTEGKGLMVPHILDVTVGFTPIHDFNVEADMDFVKKQTFISKGNILI